MTLSTKTDENKPVSELKKSRSVNNDLHKGENSFSTDSKLLSSDEHNITSHHSGESNNEEVKVETSCGLNMNLIVCPSGLKNDIKLDDIVNDSSVSNEDIVPENWVDNPEPGKIIIKKISDISITSNTGEKSKKKSKSDKSRCGVCNKKLKLVETVIGKCKCEFMFCSKHRFPREHDCTFNHKEEGMDQLRRLNPVVKSSQIDKI